MNAYSRKLNRLSSGVLVPVAEADPGEITQWSVAEIELTSQSEHDWWELPVQATFAHAGTGTEIAVDGFCDGGNTCRVRFALPLPGEWTWRTASLDPGLNNVSGSLTAMPPTPEQIDRNPNYRGHLRIADSGRYFEHADGAPFFLMADTLWAGNSARCGLGENEDGPFYGYIADRKAVGFTAILMQYMRGFGDTTNEPAGQRNEGGHPFVDGDVGRLNPAYFRALDVRMDAFWRSGFAMATPCTWFGKMRNCFFTLTWAKRISAYLMARYGAYNIIWSLSGEYQYTFRDCGWTPEQIGEIGDTVQAHNPYRHPVSIHPSGGTQWPPPHGEHSSKAYHTSGWLDHNWLQTGQSIDRMCNIATRSGENYGLEPVKPVFCSEAYYERPPDIDPEGGYHSRWQPWCAYLNGAIAGYGYGAFGLWQFYDPDDPEGETGKVVKGVAPWREAIAYEGASYLQHVRTLLTSCDWWRLEPHRNRLTVNGVASPMPTESDLTPPHCAAIPGEFYIVYIPRGNSARTLCLTDLGEAAYTAKWFNPRNGGEIPIESPPSGLSQWTIPDRPDPSDEDWVLVLENPQ